MEYKSRWINTNVKSINFDYFVERGTILTEMARVTRTFTDYEAIENAYGDLRKHFKKKISASASSSTIDMKVFGYMYSLIEDYLPEDQVAEWSVFKPQNAVNTKNNCVASLKQLLSMTKEESPEDHNALVSELINNMQDFERFEDFVRLKKTISSSNRMAGAEKQKVEKRGMSIEEYDKLGIQLAPKISELNRIMVGRRVSKAKGGTVGQYNAEEPEAPLDPKMQTAENIYTVLGQISKIRLQLETNDELELNIKPGEESLYATAEDPSSSLVKNLKRVSKIEFKGIEYLMTLIEKKIEENVGQSLEGFLKMINSIKSSPTTSKYAKGVFDAIVNEIQSSEKIEDMYQPEEDAAEFPGYDDDAVRKVFTDPLELEMFGDWLFATNAWKEELERKLTLKYEAERAKLEAMLAGNYVSSGDEKDAFAAFWAKKNKPEPKTQEFKIPDMEKAAQQHEGVEVYMMEQSYKDSKFNNSPNGKFVDRGFKKFSNYNHWITSSD